MHLDEKVFFLLLLMSICLPLTSFDELRREVEGVQESMVGFSHYENSSSERGVVSKRLERHEGEEDTRDTSALGAKFLRDWNQNKPQMFCRWKAC